MIAAYLLAYVILGLIVVYLRGIAEARIAQRGVKVEDVSPIFVCILWPLVLPNLASTFGRLRK